MFTFTNLISSSNVISNVIYTFLSGAAAENSSSKQPAKPKEARKPKQNKQGVKGVTAERAKNKRKSTRKATKQATVSKRTQRQRSAIINTRRGCPATKEQLLAGM
jgi:hypothetical protein